jgi:molecular chaperone GrpE
MRREQEQEREPSGGEPGADARVAELEAQVRELNDKWLRAVAELDNYKKRVAREKEEIERGARERVLTEIVALADDLERALDAAEQAEHGGPIVSGVRLVHDRVREILRAHGVEVVDPAGKPFDPHEAEAVLEVDAPGQVPGTVVTVIEKATGS